MDRPVLTAGPLSVAEGVGVENIPLEMVQFSRRNLLKLVEEIEQMELKGNPVRTVHWMQLKRGSTLFRTRGYPIREPLDYLRNAQTCWERHVCHTVKSTCYQLCIPLARFREESDRDELINAWGHLSQYEVDVSLNRPIYAPKNLLEVLMSVRSDNSRVAGGEDRWQFCDLPLPSKDMAALRELYAEISRGDPLMGVDIHVQMPDIMCPTLEAERTRLGEEAVLTNTVQAARDFLKHGSTRELRGHIWMQALQSHALPHLRTHYNRLKHHVLRYDLFVDKLVIKDILLTLTNDEHFFVFDDVLYEVLLLFTRDTQVLPLFHQCASTPMHTVPRGRPPNLRNAVVYPPCGVIPFHGFCMYASPFCYVYRDKVQVYFTFRKCYTRYFYKLHEVSSDPQGLLSLCLLYERLLRRHEPEIWLHFQEVGVLPLGPAFKWIMRAFSGHLPVEQLLYLWDVIFAYDSMEIVPLLAVTILSFRKTNLLKVNTVKGVEAVLGDLSSIVVMPLIQFALIRK